MHNFDKVNSDINNYTKYKYILYKKINYVVQLKKKDRNLCNI